MKKPSKKNQRALLLRRALVLAVFIAQALIIRGLYDVPNPDRTFEDKMFLLMNQSRAEEDLPPLTRSSILDRGAKAKLEDMFEKKYYAHKDPKGREPFHFFVEAGYPYKAAGENLARQGMPTDEGYFDTPEDVQKAFMASPTHQENVLNALYKDIGLYYRQGYLVVFFGEPK